MKILDRHPFTTRPTILDVQGDLIDIRRNQIVVWLSIGDARRRFPALVDTGRSHNMSISSSQLQRWSGETLQAIGDVNIGKEVVVQYAAEVHVRRSVKGIVSGTYPPEMPQGISVIDDHSPAAPRVPLLGLRTLISNKLRLIVDGGGRA
jgi:hypothetical protein